MRIDLFGRVARTIGAAVVLVLVVVAFTPVINVVASWTRPPLRVQKSEAIVVLGAGVNPDGSLNPASLVRLIHGVVLYRTGWAPVMVVSGTPAEAQTRARLAYALGVPPAAIVGEISSHTTRDEAQRIGALLRARGVKTILLVTNTRHLLRATRLFQNQGLVVSAVPADLSSESSTQPEVRLELLRSITQEMVARLYYRLTGAL